MFTRIFLMASCIIAFSNASRTPLEIKQFMLAKSMECSSKHSLDSKELQLLLNFQFPDTKNSKCFINCIFRKFEWMDDKGLYNMDAAIKFAEEEYKDEPTKLDNSKKLFDMCKGVNDEAADDGEAGCDRANSLAKCLVENAPKMGFHVQLETK